MRPRIEFLLALLVAAAPAAAQQPQPQPTPYQRAIAAGYKALTSCSALYLAGRTLAQIEALELTGIYGDYDAIVPTLTAEVDRPHGRVSVRFAGDMPPRVAQAFSGQGCRIYPIGWTDPAGVVPSNFTAPPTPAAGDWPMGDERATAAAVGDRAKLDAAVAAAMDGNTFGPGSRTTAVVVLQNGRIVAERYAEGFGPNVSQRTWSVAKSLAGTIVGAAVHRGLIDPAQPAPIPEWIMMGDPRAAITLDQLMRMASGLHSSTAGNRTDAIYFGGTAVTEETTAWPLAVRPGTRFRYANNDILLAIHALRYRLDDDDRPDFPARLLFRRIGMNRTVAETDWLGNYILSSQVWSTARDLARFGLLYANDGVWNGERILPKGWRDYVTRPSGPQPDGGFGYGATFWLFGKSPGLPADSFAALGNRGQSVVIVPSRNIVIVRRGEDAGGAPFVPEKFAAAILAALR